MRATSENDHAESALHVDDESGEFSHVDRPAQLPAWLPREQTPSGFRTMVIVGTGLSTVGGYLNAASFVLFGTGTTSLTGTASSSAVAAVSPHSSSNSNTTLRGINIFGAYLFGSFLCGLIIRNKAFHIRRRYGVVLMFESLMICAAAILVHNYPDSSNLWSSFVGEALVACGAALQNSSFTTFSSAIVRTTHITGMVADAGSILGQVIWYRDLRNVWKLAVFGPLVGAFIAGSLLGGYAALQFRHVSLYFASLALLISSLGFIMTRFVRRRLITMSMKRNIGSSCSINVADVAQNCKSDEVDSQTMISFSDGTLNEETSLIAHRR